MRLLLLGATGGTGQALVTQALDRGHVVTALVRSPHKLTVTHERLHVVAGELTADALGAALASADALVSALGATDRAPTTILADSSAQIIRAMQAAHKKRVVVVSSALLFTGMGLPGRIFGYVFRNALADARVMEERLAASDLDWTVLRPPRLTDGQPTGRYRIAGTAPPARSIRRADLAQCLLDVVGDHLHGRAIVGVSK